MIVDFRRNIQNQGSRVTLQEVQNRLNILREADSLDVDQTLQEFGEFVSTFGIRQIHCDLRIHADGVQRRNIDVGVGILNLPLLFFEVLKSDIQTLNKGVQGKAGVSFLQEGIRSGIEFTHSHRRTDGKAEDLVGGIGIAGVAVLITDVDRFDIGLYTRLFKQVKAAQT